MYCGPACLSMVSSHYAKVSGCNIYEIKVLSREKAYHCWGSAKPQIKTEEFYKQTPPEEEKLSIQYLLNYLNYKKQIFQLFFLLLLGTLTALIFPILTQKLID